MRIEVTGEEHSGSATEEQIVEALALLTGESGEAFAILSASEMTYIQTSGWPEVGFDLEYQEGSLEQHYRCTKESLNLAEITRAFKQYLRNDPSYKSELPWERDEMLADMEGSQDQFSGSRWLLLGLVAAIIATLLMFLLT